MALLCGTAETYPVGAYFTNMYRLHSTRLILRMYGDTLILFATISAGGA